MVDIPTRHTEAETRRLEDVAWREKVRTEDLAEREALRLEREAGRKEREIARAEDVAWREKVRTEDLAERDASRTQTLQCLVRGLASLASVQNAKPGTVPEDLARMAQDFAHWIIGTTDPG